MTERQKEIYRLRESGMLLRDIAKELGVTSQTISHNLKNTYNKLGEKIVVLRDVGVIKVKIKPKETKTIKIRIEKKKIKKHTHKKRHLLTPEKLTIIRYRERVYRNNNVNFRIANNLRRRLRLSLSKKSLQKNNKTMFYVGCSKEEFKKYIESLFDEKMSWNNYGKNGWHIDHIKPISLFDLSNEGEIKKAMHYTNLQPLWWKENLKKGNKYNCF